MPFVFSVASGVLGDIGSSAIRDRVRRLTRASGVVAPAGDRRVAPQVAPRRVELTAPVTWGPPVPLPGSAPLSGPGLARELRARRPRV